MKTIRVRNGNEIIVSGDIIKPIMLNGNNLSLGMGAKAALIKALIDGMGSTDEELECCENLIGHLNRKLQGW